MINLLKNAKKKTKPMVNRDKYTFIVSTGNSDIKLWVQGQDRESNVTSYFFISCLIRQQEMRWRGLPWSS